ncbi:transposase [Mesorhizobium sp.]|uniref:IS91 family transposase n=1 Tax=Mesorhizobium sp. TaxID=1871066 RepID=UPI0034517991
MVSVAGSTRSSVLRVRRSASDGVEDARRAWDHWSVGVPLSGTLRPWTRAGSHRFPGDPSHAFALLQDPGRAARTSPLAVPTMLPPGHPRRRPPHAHNLEADTWLQHPLSTLHERRCRRPCKARFRLAGCAFAGRGSNPLDRFERFQDLHSILLSRTCPVARVVYAKAPFAGPEAVLAYLSRYTHRVAISNRRLICFDKNSVTFRYKDYRRPGAERQQVMTIATDEFIRRFLLHVLPRGFHRIRHYGLLAGSARKASLALARELLKVAAPSDDDTTQEPDDFRPSCPCCGGRMIVIETFDRWRQPRGPPDKWTPNPGTAP